MSLILRRVLLSLLLTATAATAQDYVPDELRDWQQWVLKDMEYRGCPFYFDRGAARRSDFVCAWPGRLRLDVDSSGAQFTQTWTVYADEQWLSLPGSIDYWPDRVTVNDRAIEVVGAERRVANHVGTPH